MTKHFFERTTLEVYTDRRTAGQAAGEAAAAAVRHALEKQENARVIFAAAPSQDEVLKTLCEADGIDWQRVTAFHMDEYIGLPADAPQRFANYLHKHIFSVLPFGEICLLEGGEPEELCRRYAEKLSAAPFDVVCLGIGENGHIAFNDPPVANFDDPVLVKIVNLDTACRQQQVNDGCFDSLAAVPRQAVTLTIPALMRGKRLICTVPGSRKRDAVHAAMEQPLSVACPASILRTHPNCTLFVDRDCWE